MTKNLTEGKPLSVLFFFALPMLLGNIFQQFYNLADSVIVGNFVGSDALAAVGGTFPISFLAIAIATGASTGCSIVISHAFGAENNKKVSRAITTSLILVSFLGLIIMLLSLIFLKPLLVLLGTPSDIFNASYSYLKIIFWGCIFIYIYNCLTAIFNALGDSKTPLKFLIVSTILNVGLDLIFVLCFKMGSDGAGYATLISQAAATIGLFIYFLIKMKYIISKEKQPLFDKTLVKEMIKYAIPSIIQQTIVSLGMMTVQGLVNSYGKDFVAGYSAATKIDAIAVMPMINISLALSTFTAQNVGAKKMDRVNKGFNAAMLMCVVASVLCTCVLVLFGKFFVGMFVDSDASMQVINYGNDYFKVVSLFYILLAVMFCSNGVHRGLGNMKIFMFSTFCNITARITLAYALKPLLGYTAIFWALPIGWLVSGSISFIYFKSGKWKRRFE